MSGQGKRCASKQPPDPGHEFVLAEGARNAVRDVAIARQEHGEGHPHQPEEPGDLEIRIESRTKSDPRLGEKAAGVRIGILHEDSHELHAAVFELAIGPFQGGSLPPAVRSPRRQEPEDHRASAKGLGGQDLSIKEPQREGRSLI